MKSNFRIFTFIFLLFCITVTAQDKIYVHTATASNSSGETTYIDHSDLNNNPNAGLVFVHNYNPIGTGGTLNNKVTGLWYDSSSNKWAIYNEDASPMIIGSSYNVYIDDGTDVFTHVSTLANQGAFGAAETTIDHPFFNTQNPGPFAVMSNYYNPNGVLNNQNYGFYYDTTIDRRVIYEEGGNPIPTNAAFNILIHDNSGSAVAFNHLSTTGNVTGSVTILDHPSLNNNPNAVFVFSHYWGISGTTTNIDKVLSVWYTGASWAIYTEDGSAMLTDIVFDIIVAPNDNLTYVPDDNFEAYLEENSMGNGIANDNYVLTANINTLNTLDVSSQNIADLTGIEDFVALTELRCSVNNLTNLDLSNNMALTYLDCGGNFLITLDVSANTALIELYCYNNQLTSLNVSANTALTNLDCEGNSLSTLDVSLNTALTFLDCSFNQLTSLNVANGNNTNFTTFIATSNPNLTCIEVDDVTYSTTNWTVSNGNIDAIASYSEDCTPQTYVPDDNFEQALIDLGHDAGALNNYVPTANINTITSLDVWNKNISNLTGIEDFVALEELNCSFNFLNTLDVSNNTALTELDCSANFLNTLDVSNNTALTDLNCSSNEFASLDVSLNTALTELNCSLNSLNTLDVSNNAALEEFRCSNNLLTSLDVSLNTALTHLICNNNQLTSLDVRNGNNLAITNINFKTVNNTNLTCIEVDDVAYSNVNWTDIDAQTSFSVDCSACIVTIPDANFKTYLVGNTAINTNGDTEIQCSEATAFTGIIDANSLSITDLTGIEAFTDLTVLRCWSNSLTSLDVTQNTALIILHCQDNSLTDLDVSQNTNLIQLYNHTNSLTSLDVSQNTALIQLYCLNNSLTSLDVSQNTALTQLGCNNNALTSLNVANGNNTNFTTFNATNNPNLTCIEVDNAAYSTANWTDIDSQTAFSNNCGIVTLEAKAYLQGAFINPNVGEETWMRDDLRVASLIPTTSPYTDALTCNASVFTPTGANSIVDWVWIELRDKNDNTNVLASQSALLQRDGDIVSTDGTSALSFNLPNNNYFVAVSHRNHLGIISSNTVALTASITALDLSNGFASVNGGVNAVANLGNGIFALFAGDFDGNDQIQNTDVNQVVNQLGNSGYSNADTDLNGQTQNTDINILINPNIGKGQQYARQYLKLYAKIRR